MRTHSGPELRASDNCRIFPNNLLCHLPGFVKIGCRHSPNIPCTARSPLSFDLRRREMDLACGHACQDDLAGALQNVLAFIKEPKRMNGSIGITTSVLEDQVFTVMEFFLIFLQLMGRMAILKKVDDFP